jgi:hypothetical protein
MDGEPCDRDRWMRLHEDPEKAHVALTRCGAVRVSTVWIGMWLGPLEEGRTPLIYETLVSGGPLDGQTGRYPNRVAALAGHDQWVAEVKALPR